MRTLALLLIALLAVPTAAFAGPHLSAAKNKIGHAKRMHEAAHQAKKAQSPHHHHKK